MEKKRNATHKTRGAGTLALLETEGLQRVNVEFASGEIHRYQQESWSKLITPTINCNIFRNTIAAEV